MITEKTMNDRFNIFRSRLAKRFFVMFVLCALVPTMALAVISYRGVTSQLTDQAFNRLHQSAKSHGLMIYGNLVLADNQLSILHTVPAKQKNLHFSSVPAPIAKRNGEIFSAMILLRQGKVRSSWGKGISDEGLAMIRSMDLPEDEASLLWVDSDEGWPEVIVVRRTTTRGQGDTILAASIKPSFLWGFDQGSSLPPASEFSVRDDRGCYLFSSIEGAKETALPSSMGLVAGPPNGRVMTIQGKRQYASSWSVFLKPKFHVPSWTVTVMEPRDFVLEPMTYFNRVFPPIILLSLVVVVLLSNGAIRKSLVPIDSLMRGARRVANQDFDHRVEVKSRDEFHDLADAFNSMTGQLDIQFKVLAARADLNRAILSTLDMEQIIETSLSQSSQLFRFTTAAISILDPDNLHAGHSFIHHKKPGDTSRIVSFHLADEEYRALNDNCNWLRIKVEPSTPLPSYLNALRRSDVHHFVVLPILTHDRLFGFVSMGMGHELTDSQFDLGQMRGFCDHLAVAFSNSNLIKELKDMTTGTLQALALTVDAKSPWTAGHSLRVARMAIRIATAMDLPQETVDDLERASLLHDIGKIAIRLSILDKDGKLTAEEYATVKEHPLRGARILSPVRAYAGIIPVVEQHHERFDGKGYPYGLKADEIDLRARILAVADSYDAMVSDRPYRKSLGRQRAIQIVYEEAGCQFDPAVVKAFESIMQPDTFPPSPPESELLQTVQLISRPYNMAAPRKDALKRRDEGIADHE